MKTIVKSAVAAVVGLGFAAAAQGAIIANWEFEVVTPADATNFAANGPHSPDAGAGSASGLHASALTDWTTPAGNGSVNSYSSNEWAIGDYYQFQVDLTGFQDAIVSWDQTRSSTGPATFDFQYSTDGSTFTTALNDYTVIANAAAPGVWASGGSRIAAYTFVVDLSSVSALDNDSSVFFRMTADAAAGGTGGTGRVDYVLVEATVIPEPASLSLLALGGLMGLRRRR